SGTEESGGGSSGSSSTPDATQPSVDGISVEDAATAVEAGDPFVITFSEDMDSTTITAGTITLVNTDTSEEVPVDISSSGKIVTITPTVDLDFFTEYTLTVATGTKDPSGNSLDQSYTRTFTTGDGSWKTAKTINSAGLWPAVVMDENTNALFAWSIPSGATPGIYATSYTASTRGWSDEEAIGSGIMTSFKMDMNTSGDAFAIWSKSGRTYVAKYSDASWETATAIDSIADATTYGYQDIEIDENGNAIAVFAETHTAPTIGLSANIYTAATDSWGSPTSLWDDGVYGQIAMNASGVAMAVGTPLASGGYTNVKASRYSSGSWSSPVTINSDSHDGTIYAGMQVAMDSNGNTIAVWIQDNNLWANIYSASTSSWGTAGLLETGSGAASVPQIAFDNDGNAIAVWQQSDGTYTNIYYNRYNGTAWGGATLLSNATSNATNPQIAIDKNNNAIVVWTQTNGSAVDVYAIRYVASTSLWGETEVIDNTSYTASSPQIAMGGNGTATAVWYQQNEGNISIGANRFK
ncbi:MAG: Ig-like domain-containing protein, partial [Deltaproteobacteria bacterium]|nr:Ig-like domain-containing protein [Deltaproteobacteria bacterium]